MNAPQGELADSGLLERLQNPAVNLVYVSDKLFWLDSPESRFLDAWEELAPALIMAPAVRAISMRYFVRLAWCYEWRPAQGAGEIGEFKWCWNRPHPDYLFEGLKALSVLFAAETFDAIKFRSPEEFAARAEYPQDAFKMGDTVCSYDGWRQGFVLSLLRFGATAVTHPIVTETVHKYSADREFIRRYMREWERGPRPMLSILRRFARDWDVALLPLRYFTPSAAMDFVADQYDYCTDLARFRTVFLKGGNQRQCAGLKLQSAKPYIVRAWSKNVIRLNEPTAQSHGYDALLLRKRLSERYARKVSI